VEFVLNGVSYLLDAPSVRSALRGGAPDEVREHWVDVDGVRWPPKQALAFATGIDRSEFTSHRALGLLERLGFCTSPWGAGQRASSAGRTATPHTADVSSIDTVTAREVPAASAAATIVLVGCSGSKAAEPARAAELFTGAGFRKARDLAIRSGRPWYVISAKFGLLDPEEVIAPYDVYLPKQSPRYRSAWASWVVAQLGERHGLHGAVIEAHAGSAYCDPLIGPLAEAGATLMQPLAGLGLGQRLAWYGSATGALDQPTITTSPTPDVSWLLDVSNAVSPAEFLAAGRGCSDQPGLYTWWTDAEGAHALSAGLGHRIAPGLIYAGRAGGVRPNGASSTNTLWGRLATMHLGGNREFSTFRLTLTACLSRPGGPPISESDLTAWMHEHLRIAAIPLPADAVTAGESRLLELTDAPLNLQDVASTPLRISLKRLRAAVRGR
jgi:hypothetical protein